MWWVNNVEIPYKQHTPITLEGKVDGEEVILSYTEMGARRKTVGEIKLKMNSEELAEGDFSGTAANASGTAKAEKLNE